MTLKLQSTTTWTQKRLKLGMVASFDPHNMCAKVERITTKTGCTSCTNWTISFKVCGFQTKTHLLQRHFLFLNLFQLKTFFAFNMHHSKPHTKILTLSDFICYFSCIQCFILCQMTLKMESIYKLTQKRLKLGMVSSFDPHNMCEKDERVTTKTGCTSCTNWTISFKVRVFQTKTHLLQRHFIFLSLFQLKNFVHSIC